MRNSGPWILFYLFLFPLFLLPGAHGSAQASDPGPILPKKPSSEITSYQSRTFQDLLKEGVTQYRNENFDEALEIFLHARERLKDSSVLSYYLGLTYKQLGEYKKALGYFKESVHLRPSVLDAYPEIIELLYSLDELGEAKKWIKEAEGRQVKPAQIAFLKGLVLSKEGKAGEAIKAFNLAQELDPDIAQSAKVQIALAQAREKKFEDARKSLQAAIAAGPNTDLASFAREYEKTFTALLERYRLWRFGVSIGYKYDDNVVLKPSDTIPGMDIVGGSDSSLQGSFTAGYNPLPAGPWFFNGVYHINTTRYFTITNYNQLSQTLSLSPGYNFLRASLAAPLAYHHFWLNESQYMGLLSWKPVLNYLFNTGHIGQVSAGYSRRKQYQKILDPNERRDADLYQASLLYLIPFGGGRGGFNLGYEWTYDQTEGANWVNQGNRISANATIPLSERLTLFLYGEVLHQDYQNLHTVFGVRRSDKNLSGNVTLGWELNKKVALNFQYGHTRTDSNIALYNYTRNLFNVTLEYNF